MWRLLAVLCVVSLTGGCRDQSQPHSTPSRIPTPLASALGSFDLVSVDERSGTILLTLTNSGWTIKIDVVDGIERADSETLSKDGAMGIEALYAQALSPYPGDISKEVKADKRYTPRAVTLPMPEQDCPGYILFANDRFGYGATSQDSVAYKSFITWLYCQSRKELYKIRVFAPIAAADDELLKLFTAVKCQ